MAKDDKYASYASISCIVHADLHAARPRTAVFDVWCLVGMHECDFHMQFLIRLHVISEIDNAACACVYVLIEDNANLLDCGLLKIVYCG